jgi:cold shock CspA family protein
MYHGIIASIIRTHGYGFIEHDVYDRVFFHQRLLRGVRFRDLKKGDTVNFDINFGPRVPRAFNLALVQIQTHPMIEI